jgi:multimeric flavodoxin WrbA
VTSVCVVYHSGYGHTAKQAEAVAEGAGSVDGVTCELIKTEDIADGDSPVWGTLDAAEAIIFGCPTYMGGTSAEMKRFIELTSSRWLEQKWANKLAAGFTNSGSQNGDKQNTLVHFVTLAAQQGMLWVNLNLMPGNNSTGGSVEDLNRLGASLGAMAQSDVDAGPDVAPPRADLDTARTLGERVAKCTLNWSAPA